ncbi:hypothetical protein B0H13DRAFT_1945751 [Mycena leptocephala]|nr:hypothetical protein B0H13DRAFT_1945751 [Mycena leptocephala]
MGVARWDVSLFSGFSASAPILPTAPGLPRHLASSFKFRPLSSMSATQLHTLHAVRSSAARRAILFALLLPLCFSRVGLRLVNITLASATTPFRSLVRVRRLFLPLTPRAPATRTLSISRPPSASFPSSSFARVDPWRSSIHSAFCAAARPSLSTSAFPWR